MHYEHNMFETDDVGNLFQMELLRQVRTGHPLADALIFSCATYVVSRLIPSKRSIKKWKEYVYEWVHGSNKQIKYVIENKQPQDYDRNNELQMEKNNLYYALAWFLRKHNGISERADSYKVITNCYGNNGSWDDQVTNECVMIPTSQIYIHYDDLVIRGEYDYTEDEKGKEIKDKFILYVDFDKVDIMERFLEKVLDEHYKYEQMLMSGQKIYSLNVSDFDINKLNWSHNNFRCKTRISNVILQNRAEMDIEKDVHTFLHSKDLYNQHGKTWKRGYLFYGPPGTGKTTLVKGIATKTQYNIYNVKLSRFKSDENMENLFREIPSKSIVLFEDVDCMGNLTHKRDPNITERNESETDLANVTRKNKPVGEKPSLSTLLNFIDGINSPEGIIIIMTTNHMEKLDPALLRDGRIDMRVHLKLCTKQQIIDLVENFLQITLKAADLSEIPDDILSPATVSKVLMDLDFIRSKTTFDRGTQDAKRIIDADQVVKRLLVELTTNKDRTDQPLHQGYDAQL